MSHPVRSSIYAGYVIICFSNDFLIRSTKYSNCINSPQQNKMKTWIMTYYHIDLAIIKQTTSYQIIGHLNLSNRHIAALAFIWSHVCYNLMNQSTVVQRWRFSASTSCLLWLEMRRIRVEFAGWESKTKRLKFGRAEGNCTVDHSLHINHYERLILHISHWVHC